MDPADTHPIAQVEAGGPHPQPIHAPDHLVTRHHREPRRRGPALDLIELRVADAARRDANPDLALTRHGLGQLDWLERPRAVL
ncbi:MAG: hypothetical protein MUC77_17740 [Chromatiaceae bacterium]|jgi:hypothetical protein|nr:hypothetical protein [Chromatiaceae bacterium]